MHAVTVTTLALDRNEDVDACTPNCRITYIHSLATHSRMLHLRRRRLRCASTTATNRTTTTTTARDELCVCHSIRQEIYEHYGSNSCAHVLQTPRSRMCSVCSYTMFVLATRSVVVSVFGSVMAVRALKQSSTSHSDIKFM